MLNLSPAPASDATATPARQARPFRYFIIGWSVIAIVFGGLFGWSVFAPFEGAVIAPGSVTVESRHKAIQHLEGGIVATIGATDGDQVAAGELLIRLDGTPIQAQLDNIDARLVDLLAREARLKAERDDRVSMQLARVPIDLEGTPELDETIASQAALLRVRAEARATRASILRQRIAQYREKIGGLNADIAAKYQQTALLEDELAVLQDLLDQGLAQRPRLLELDRERSALSGQIEAQRAEIAATEVAIGEAELEVLSLTEGFREEVITELTTVQTEVAALLTERTAAQDRLNRLDIRAPRAGRVLASRTHTVGGVIAPGEPVMHIVPDGDELVSLVRVMPQDIDKIQVGQPARLRFSAFNQNETPEVPAFVETVSADAVTDESTGATYFEVTLAWGTQAPLGDQFAILPGMPVEAMVRTESRNVLSYLVKPLQDSMNRTFRES